MIATRGSSVDQSDNSITDSDDNSGNSGILATRGGSVDQSDNSITDSDDNSGNSGNLATRGSSIATDSNNNNSVNDSNNDSSTNNSNNTSDSNNTVASAVLEGTISGNSVTIGVPSTQTYTTSNTIDNSAFSGTTGISQVAQNNGQNSLIQQNFTIQGNVSP